MNALKALILIHSATALISLLCYCDSEAHELHFYGYATLSLLFSLFLSCTLFSVFLSMFSLMSGNLDPQGCK